MQREYYRPLVQHSRPRPKDAVPLAGGPCWFRDAWRYRRGEEGVLLPASDIPETTRFRLSAPRLSISGLTFERTRLLGVLNVTPDSFSDGGLYKTASVAVAHGKRLAEHGADMIDIGGESTRPGAQAVPIAAEIARIEPVVRALSTEVHLPLSIDTRKSAVAEVALNCGASLVNDVSGFTYDPMLANLCLRRAVPACVMHALGDPETMQDNPRYDDVLLDVYDFLEAQVVMLEDMGIPRTQIIIDPGIGFGKTQDHNLTLLSHISTFHSLGCVLLVGASRKGFIGRMTGTKAGPDRMPGSVGVALAAAAQGVQVIRVHDVSETRKALTMWEAATFGEALGT